MDDDTGGAPACMAHLLVDGQPVDPETARDVGRFRRAERQRLLNARQRISGAERTAMTAELARTLTEVVAPRPGLVIAAYWPIRGEPDLRDWMGQAHDAGAVVLLPVVTAREEPLAFRRWSPGCAMTRDACNVPIPAAGAEMVPQVMIAPLLGVDEGCFRLGNGGGCYDRTLPRLDPPARVIGVGFPDCRVPTIFPMPWDVPMDSVVLADGLVRHRAAGGAA